MDKAISNHAVAEEGHFGIIGLRFGHMETLYMPTMQSLGIDQLSVTERIALAQEIWDSIVAEQMVPDLTEAQQRELERRMANLDANPDNVLTWEEIKARITGKQ
jgi:putative addiction module component (TIGR02574 family)